VRQIIEKALNVTIQNPVHLLPRDRDVQRIQRLMLAMLWPEAVRENPKILFVNLVEDRDHSLLNNPCPPVPRPRVAVADHPVSV
jgi:hypothetical protein